MEAGCQTCPSFRQGPLSEVGNPHPKQPSEMRQLEEGLPHPAECLHPGAVGQSPHGGWGGPMSSVL